MKASLKFREEQKPLFRTKVPLSILGLPFQSGIVAGESKELTLNLSTFFASGPSLRVSYRPNDPWNPFSLVVKTGTGPFGSPVSSSMLMSAEFNLLGKGNPGFMLHFKPQFGDFSIKKSQSSSVLEKNVKALQNSAVFSSDEEGSIDMVETPAVVVNGGGSSSGNGFQGKKIRVLSPPTASAIAGAFSGVEITATTKLPVSKHALVNFRWGVRVPAEIKSGGGGWDSTAAINFRKIPFLVMDKIGIEHVDVDDCKSKAAVAAAAATSSRTVGPEFGNTDVAETFLTVKRQLEVLQAENGQLRKAVDDLRHEMASSKFELSPPASNFGPAGSKSGNGARVERRSNEKKPIDADVNEELRKALKGATGGGI